MARISAAQAGGKNVIAFLDMIAVSEIGEKLLSLSDDGYNVLVGATPARPLLFDSYATHPNKYNAGLNSTAAGRYQFLARYFPFYKASLSLCDFGPVSQDVWAIAYLREGHALDAIKAGNFQGALQIVGASRRWASLPGSNWGQHENDVAMLRSSYLNAGGAVA